MNVKKYKRTYIGFAALGIVLDVIAALASRIPDFQLGLLSGMGSNFIAIGLIKYIRLVRILKNPDKAREYEAAMKDERMLFIANKARAWTFIISILAELTAGMIALFAFNERLLGQAMCYLVCGQCLLFVVFFWVLQRKY